MAKCNNLSFEYVLVSLKVVLWLPDIPKAIVFVPLQPVFLKYIHTTFTPSIEPQFQKNNFEINQNLFKTWLRLFHIAMDDPVIYEYCITHV